MLIFFGFFVFIFFWFFFLELFMVFFFFFGYIIWGEKGGGPYGAEVTRGQDLSGKDFSGKSLVKQDFKTVCGIETRPLLYAFRLSMLHTFFLFFFFLVGVFNPG